MTLRKIFELYYRPELIEEGRTTTAASYETAISRWERHSANLPVDQIDNASLEGFRRAVLAAGLRPATFNLTWRSIRALLRRLGPQHDRNPRGLSILDRIPYVKLAPEDFEFPRVATSEELSALYDACEHACWPSTVLPPREFWRTAIVIAYNVGARRRDIFDLRTEDVDFEKRTIRFRARKTRRRQCIPLNDTTITHLKAVWSERENLFPGNHGIARASTTNRMRIEWRRLLQRAGIKPPFGFQTLRKTCATMYADTAGIDVAACVLGHYIGGGVTAQFYANPTKRIVEAVNALPQPESFKGVKVFCVPRPNRRIDFVFEPGSVTFRDKIIRLPRRPLAVLRALVSAGRPLGFEELAAVAFWDDPAIDRRTIKGAVHRLRASLSRALRLPELHDPLPWDRFGDRRWALVLPAQER